MKSEWIADEIPGLFQVIRLSVLRRTEGVDFDIVPILKIKSIQAVDRVIHRSGAISPGAVAGVTRPWYMHPHQEDHLLVLHGARMVELWSEAHPHVVRFKVSAEGVFRDGKPACDGPSMLAWTTRVFHRIESDPVAGSASINFAARHPGYDVLTNFSIYDLDPGSGVHRVIRDGHLDQPEEVNRGK